MRARELLHSNSFGDTSLWNTHVQYLNIKKISEQNGPGSLPVPEKSGRLIKKDFRIFEYKTADILPFRVEMRRGFSLKLMSIARPGAGSLSLIAVFFGGGVEFAEDHVYILFCGT